MTKPFEARARGGAGARRDERGSALVMAIFVLVLLTAMGAALLFVSENEMKTGQVDLRSKTVFYASEAGLEDARETLRVMNLAGANAALRGSFNDELTAAAGPNGAIDFDPATLKPVFDANGDATGFSGYGDDMPLKGMTAFGGGKYAAFLTNDAVDGRAGLSDSNERVMITAIGTGPNQSSEIVQAIVERDPFPSMPSTITMIGPLPNFDGGNSNSKKYVGDDCAGGVAGLSVPTVGVIGSAAEASAEAGVHKPNTYTSGGATGLATVTNISGSIDPSWKDCNYLHDLARKVRGAADVVGTSSTPNSSLGTTASRKIVYIEGDYTVGGGYNGGGLLWVTGTLTFDGNASWAGTIFTVGKGNFQRTGGGNGVISGANFVANVAGPDGLMWTSDDCSGPDGILGNSDDGPAAATYNNTGGGTGDTKYCTTDISSSQDEFPFKIVSFRQR
jgi:Tfp pilus assembly protein PilX